MDWWEWLFWIVLVLAVIAAIVIPIFFGSSGHGSNGHCKCKPTWAMAAQPDTPLVLTASATGPTGTAVVETGFLDLLSTTIDDHLALLLQQMMTYSQHHLVVVSVVEKEQHLLRLMR